MVNVVMAVIINCKNIGNEQSHTGATELWYRKNLEKCLKTNRHSLMYV